MQSPELLLRNSIQLYDHFVLTIAHGDKNILVKSAKDEKYELNVDSYHKKICKTNNKYISNPIQTLPLYHPNFLISLSPQ